MICFPNAKINLGLNVTGVRNDGYHTIETIFYPIPLCDALEIVPSDTTKFTQTGLSLDSTPMENLVMKAHTAISKKYDIQPMDIYLKKAIPSKAGLGGGSSDAVFMLKFINKLCKLNIMDSELGEYALHLGSDCSFFLKNKPVIATGTGSEFTDIDISLKGYTIYVIKPQVSISTKEAYDAIKPKRSIFSLLELPTIPISEWKNILVNDFEPYAFKKYPIIKEIKETLYRKGAEYASMTGSGSAVFGLFKNTISPQFNNCFVWKGTLD